MCIKARQEEFMSARLSAVLSMNQFGFALSLKECRHVLQAHELEAVKRWDELSESILGRDLKRELENEGHQAGSTFGFSRLSRLFGFGYRAGHEVCRLFGGTEADCNEAGVIAATFNIFSSLFDKICDRSEMLQKLVSVVNETSIIGELNGLPLISPADAYRREPLIIRVTLHLIRQYFAMCRRVLIKSSDVLNLRREFVTTILDSYSAQIRSVTCTFEGSSQGRDDLLDTLFAKSALPSWLFFMTSVMCLSRPRLIDIRGLRDCAIGIGRAIWIADDLQDLGRDLESHTWNYAWVLLCYDHGVSPLRADGKLEASARLMRELFMTGALGSATRDLCRSLRDSFASLEKLSGQAESKDFHNALEARLKLWILSS